VTSGDGYAEHMLVVVVLVPIVIMILACSLERFEALTTKVAPAPPRTPIPEPSPEPAVTTGSHLRLVPGSGPVHSASLDAPTERLQRAS
jgi:hypothetical protein